MRRLHLRPSLPRRADFAGSRAPSSRVGQALDLLPRRGLVCVTAATFCLAALGQAAANPALVVDAATGDVLYAQQATEPWYPASLTKLMTFYVALSAVRDHKISIDTPIRISARAARAAPSKMGFKPGTEVTLGNALKMMMVKSANDLAIAIAEGISGSVEAFAEDMNTTAAQLGMQQSHFVTPNGLPNSDHVSSAHDLAVLARAIYANFPQEAQILSIGELRLGDELIPNHNTLLGRYPGVDGMKTGFTCAAGFNLVASAERNGHRYIAVVLGAPSVPLRTLKTAVLLDRAFDGVDHPIGKLDELAGGGPSAAPDMHNEVCRHRAKAAAAFQAEIGRLEAPLLNQSPGAPTPALALSLLNGGAGASLAPVAPTIGMMPKPSFDPVSVYVGPAPGYQGPVAEARPDHSPVGTPPVAQPAAAAANPQPEEPAEKPVATAEAKPHHHHLIRKPVVKITGKTKVAKGKASHRLAKLDANKKQTASGDADKEDGKTTLKNHKAKPAHAEKPAKKHLAQKHSAQKHLSKHAAAGTAPTSAKTSAKTTDKTTAPAAQ